MNRNMGAPCDADVPSVGRLAEGPTEPTPSPFQGEGWGEVDALIMPSPDCVRTPSHVQEEGWGEVVTDIPILAHPAVNLHRLEL